MSWHTPFNIILVIKSSKKEAIAKIRLKPWITSAYEYIKNYGFGYESFEGILPVKKIYDCAIKFAMSYITYMCTCKQEHIADILKQDEHTVTVTHWGVMYSNFLLQNTLFSQKELCMYICQLLSMFARNNSDKKHGTIYYFDSCIAPYVIRAEIPYLVRGTWKRREKGGYR